MGLDIYLETAERQRESDAYDHASGLWYESDTYKTWKTFAEDKYGLKYPFEMDRESEDYKRFNDEYHQFLTDNGSPWTEYQGRWDDESKALTKSRRYPDEDTLNNRRYLRSSYNGGGFNSAVPRMLTGTWDRDWDPDYYGIFAPILSMFEKDEYSYMLNREHVAALEEVSLRAGEVIGALEECDGLTTTRLETMGASYPITEEDLLTKVREALVRDKNDAFGGGGWTSRDMSFFGTEGMTILGMAWVNAEYAWGPPVEPVVVFRSQAKDHYIQSANIIQEFIEEAIEMINQDGECSMNWSG